MARSKFESKPVESKSIEPQGLKVDIPRVGRIVHYVHDVCCAAIVVNTNSEVSIGLTVFLPNGDLLYRGHVLPGDAPGQWHWPETV